MDGYYSTVKRYDGNSYVDIASIKRYDGSAWANCYESVPLVLCRKLASYPERNTEIDADLTDGLWLYDYNDYAWYGSDEINYNLFFNYIGSGIPAPVTMKYTFDGIPAYSNIFIYRNGRSYETLDFGYANGKTVTRGTYMLPEGTTGIEFVIGTYVNNNNHYETTGYLEVTIDNPIVNGQNFGYRYNDDMTII